MNQLPDFARQSFARTNAQTIAQRAKILRELVSDVRTIGELCCGDCTAQSEMYHLTFGEITYCGLDVAHEIVALNRSQHVRCLQGNVMDVESLRLFIEFNVLFFGPPLSVDCDGHRLLSFGEVTPSFPDFARLLWCELSYFGTCVFICPNTTTLGEVRRLYAQVKSWRPEVGLRLLHYSHATITGNGEEHAPRLKYIELWFSSVLPDEWEMCHSYPPP